MWLVAVEKANRATNRVAKIASLAIVLTVMSAFFASEISSEHLLVSVNGEIGLVFIERSSLCMKRRWNVVRINVAMEQNFGRIEI